MKILKKLNKVDDIYISDLKDKYEINMPNSYKQFLLEFRGGVPDKRRYFKKLNCGGVYDFKIDGFMGLSDEPAFDLLFNYTNYYERIPYPLVPISMDGVGNVICIGTNEEFYDKVYIWYVDEEAYDDDEVTFDNVEKLSDSFEEFLNDLI